MNLTNPSLNIGRAVFLLSVWFALKGGLPLCAAPADFLTPPVDFACNDTIHVSLNGNCQALIEPDDILEGDQLNYNEFSITLTKANGDPVPNPVNGTYIGQTIFVKATHLPTGNSCWGHALIEDKWAPTISCTNAVIPCFQNFNTAFLPTMSDNCDATPTRQLINQTINEDNPCTGVIITRTFIAIDDSGNISAPCTQTLTTTMPPLPDFPEDTSWQCHVYEAHPNVINGTALTGNLNTTGSGVPNVALGVYCPYQVGKHDVALDGCGETFSIVRTWTVLNWCTGQVHLTDINGDDNVQIIKVKDTLAPVIVRPPYNVAANISGVHGCFAINLLLPATVTDNCHGFSQRIFTPVGEANYVNGIDGANGGLIPSPGLPLGVHTVIYVATDECSNTDTLHVPVTIVDETSPTAVCDEITTVSLSIDGIAVVEAGVYDDGSYDLCCLDSFSVRRMATTCNLADTAFRKTVTFCCADVGDTVQVVFRAVDCAGNFNDCMVSVIVEDKLPPVMISCPPNKEIDCRWYADSLEIPLSQGNYDVLDVFGEPVFLDNCNLVYLDTSVSLNLDNCLQGTITRRWRVTDPGQNGFLNCVQRIGVKHVSDWVVEFPPDVHVTCTDTLPATGYPEIFFENCELIAISHNDQYFPVVDSACFKIVRSWIVINWCATGANVDQEVVESNEIQLNTDLNGDGVRNARTFRDGLNTANAATGAVPDGYIIYQQKILVEDDLPPVVNCPAELNFCILENDCDVSFDLPLLGVQDCSEEISYTANGDLGEGLSFTNVPPGAYSMTYRIADNCGNTSFCQTTIRVRDCKNPTPFCLNGLSITLEQDTIVVIHADDFDGGSVDNCPGDLNFSFSADLADTLRQFDCFDLGFAVVNVYVTDASGNQSFCETFVFVDDNQGVCQGPPRIAGSLKTATNLPINRAAVAVNGDTDETMETSADGQYSFEVPWGGDYSVSAEKDTFPLNGVTTFDLVLISKHILGLQPLDSPYKIIAADANGSNSVTTADLVAIRKLILQITDEFPNNTPSWRFLDKHFIFPNPLNPFTVAIPEVLNFNNLTADRLDADFIGIKVGDVNNSANPQ
jgi:hypothetical protein